MTTGGSQRLTGGDVLMQQLGVNPPVQLLWRVQGRPAPEALARIHCNLAQGPLNRRMRAARLPLARPVWERHTGCRPLRVSPKTVAPEEVMDWADASCRVELDAHGGRGWELSAAHVADGTSVVSLVGSHALTDGQGLIGAATLAARETVRQGRSGPPSLVDDITDALTEGVWTYSRLALARLRDKAAEVPATAGRLLFGRSPQGGGAAPVRSRLAFTVSAAEAERVAERGGGSVTGLMLAMTANILRAARGTTEAGRPFTLGLPVSFRRPGDLESSNMVGIATLCLDGLRGRYTDLSEIRRLSKAAYSEAVGRHLTGYPQTDAALSNAGEILPEARDVFGPALGILFRTVSGAGGPPGRMNCFVLRAGETVSVGFQSAGVEVDHGLVELELDAWGIAPTHTW
ncbi:hypothetical protein ACFUIY_26605 [Streptomyces griseorubiginosus]|uniref:hypothetical protein n=1 Tax=Streptomyces griseorubiginosus TaxID=67304 RepID=UPI00363BAA7C